MTQSLNGTQNNRNRTDSKPRKMDTPTSTSTSGSLLSRFTDLTRSANFLGRKEPIKEDRDRAGSESPELPARKRALSRDDDDRDKVRTVDMYVYIDMNLYMNCIYSWIHNSYINMNIGCEFVYI